MKELLEPLNCIYTELIDAVERTERIPQESPPNDPEPEHNNDDDDEKHGFSTERKHFVYS